MPRFHFNVYDGFTRPDPKGKELPNLKAARAEAIRIAGAILEEDALIAWVEVKSGIWK